MEFSGTPKKYLRMSIILSLALNSFLYLGMVFLQYGLNDKNWILGWMPLLIAVLFTIWFARASYRWIMRLDGQFGSGKGWSLESRPIKLPERIVRSTGQNSSTEFPPERLANICIIRPLSPAKKLSAQGTGFTDSPK